MTIDAYLDNLQGKDIAVVGLGISNRPLVKLLLSKGLHVTCYDKTPVEKLSDEVRGFTESGAELCCGDNYLDLIKGDVIFRTPGLNRFVPQLTALEEQGSIVTSEMEAFFETCPCRIIAVTGSDGKTTTTMLIAKLMETTGKRVYCGGNIGTPLFDKVSQMTADDIAVLELSSFQLMGMKMSPSTAVITNLSPNHLDIHKDMEEYVSSKENIYLHQDHDGMLVLNLDNEITRPMEQKARGKVRFFSRRQPVENGYYLRNDGMICRRAEGSEFEIMAADDIRIPGVHNIENYMAAFCAVDGLVTPEAMKDLAMNFNGVSHRIELIRTLNDVRYYDSSIDSSPNRTIAALNSFHQKVIMIAGGKDKGISYAALGPEVIKHVKVLVLTGKTAGVIRASVEACPEYDGSNPTIVDIAEFDDAIRTAHQYAKPGDVVILTPASTSFDRFHNFEERGFQFQKVVNEL